MSLLLIVLLLVLLLGGGGWYGYGRFYGQPGAAGPNWNGGIGIVGIVIVILVVVWLLQGRLI